MGMDALPLIDGIRFAIATDAATNILDELGDYDNRHGVNLASSKPLAELYMRSIDASSPVDVLEVGCGTGLLTIGLSNHELVRRLIAVDISRSFLQLTRDRIIAHGNPERVEFLCADLSESNSLFSDHPVDAVFGNSLLHHIYDVDSFLLGLKEVVRPGGRIVFSEPCQQGKSLLSFLAGAVLCIDDARSTAQFDEQDRRLISAFQTIYRREIETRDNPEMKLQWEDKHVFDTRKLAYKASDLGFSGFEARNTHAIQDGLKLELQRNLHMMGVDRPLDSFTPLFEVFQREYIDVYGIETPHQFITFIR